jgi:protein-L-isoaspartate(D-aspartate) O-methyltransferase
MWKPRLIRLFFTGLLVLLGSGLFGPAVPADDYASQRNALVGEIRRETRWVEDELGRDELDPKVLEAIGSVPRHEFVPDNLRSRAYVNRPLPIGYGQTISQPFIVALMTDLLRVKPEAKVLEIGTGSGYQAAVLARMGARVFTIEIIPELARAAGERLKRLGYADIEARTGDGYFGWPEHAPFDGILVAAAVSQIPPPLAQQLKPGGRMVIPVGESFLPQYLVLVDKAADGKLTTRQLLPVQFVPLTGGH